MANDVAETGEPTSMVSLGDYVAIARRRWIALSVGLLIGLALGAAWYLLAPRAYEARATVVINPITDEVFTTTAVNQLVNMATEAEIMRSIDVAERAVADSGLARDPRDLRQGLTVTVPQSALTLDVDFTTDNPDDAALGANTFANAYLDLKEEAAEARRASYAERLRSRLDDLAQEYDELPRSSDRRSGVQQEIVAVRQALGDAVALPISAGNVVTSALSPRFPARPVRLTSLAGGLVLGLALGILLAALRHRRDDRLFDSAEVERAAGVPVVGELPPVRSRRAPTLRDQDDIALLVKRLSSLQFGYGLRRWVLVRADVGGPTQAVIIARRLAAHEPTTLVTSAGAVSLRSTANDDGEAAISGDVEGHVVVDGHGFIGLAEAIAVEDVQAIVLVVELGATRRRELRRAVTELRFLVPDLLTPGIVVIRRSTLFGRLRRGQTDTAVASIEASATVADTAGAHDPPVADTAHPTTAGSDRSRAKPASDHDQTTTKTDDTVDATKTDDAVDDHDDVTTTAGTA